MKIRHGAWGLPGIHTFFIIDILSTKAFILLDNWLLVFSWLVINSIISSCFCFQNQKRLPYGLGTSQKLCYFVRHH
jgi:hypothetical protein